MGQGLGPGGAAENVDYSAIEQSPEFSRLRSTHRRFVIPVVSAGLAGYIAYALLASWGAGFMSTRVLGNVNWAIILGLAQILATFAVTVAYVWFANRKLDPKAAQIREAIEAGAGGVQ
ncbi:MAG: DUF485 domain-containing protein [Bifidobacteriaceae bacterium]|jgi:uncharacterized membrane protein (DUF485 family)|nr:DUF485 domain-containing protein [Bifidobacteriaceae bacterium]